MGLKIFEKKLDTEKLITLEQAKKYEKKYKEYIFPVEEIRDGKAMCRPQLKQQQENLAVRKEEKRRKRNNNLAHIYADGKYRNTAQNINTKMKERRVDSPKQYNNWQSAKKYNAESYQR